MSKQDEHGRRMEENLKAVAFQGMKPDCRDQGRFKQTEAIMNI